MAVARTGRMPVPLSCHPTPSPTRPENTLAVATRPAIIRPSRRAGIGARPGCPYQPSWRPGAGRERTIEMMNDNQTSSLAPMSLLMAGVGILVALVTVRGVATETNRKPASQNPIMTRDKIIEGNMRRLGPLRANAKFMSEDQEKAMGILGTYRSTEAAPKLVKTINVKRRPSKLFSPIAGGYRSRLSKPNEYPAVDALVSIGLPSVWAIRDHLDDCGKAVPDVKQLQLYAKVIRGVLPSNLVRAFVVEMKEGAPKNSKHVYDKLLKLPDVNPLRVRIQREPDSQPTFPTN